MKKGDMYLFYDTETSGLPRNFKAPVTALDNWPRMVQLAWQQVDVHGNLLHAGGFIIRPVGFTIPEDASRIHGITTERALAEGFDLKMVLEDFASVISRSEVMVAHNIAFDEKIVGAEFLRMQVPHALPEKQRICTMKQSTAFCALPGKYGFKWPTLTELHRILFETDFQEAHDASVDVSATVRCFLELQKRGIIT